MTHRAALAPLLLLLAACGDDTSAGTGGSSSSTSGEGGGATSTTTPSSSAAGGGDGGDGPASTGSSTGGGGSTGDGGGGGTSWEGVDPLAATGPVELIGGGFSFVEGPLWLASLGVLRWSDIPPARIHQLDGDVVSTWREDSGGSNGLALTPDGLLIACEGAARRLAVSPLGAPSFTLIADRYQGDRLNAPNDAIVREDGTIYFTDPDYGLPGNQHEIGFNGVYRIDTEGTVHLVDDTRELPNGIALSPDQQTLYVADNGNSEIAAYAIAPDGTTGEGALLTVTEQGPDGMAVDDAGNLYVTTQAGIDVRRADGTAWGIIAIPETPANCTFGGPERNVLFVTARTGLYRVQLVIPGLP